MTLDLCILSGRRDRLSHLRHSITSVTCLFDLLRAQDEALRCCTWRELPGGKSACMGLRASAEGEVCFGSSEGSSPVRAGRAT
jgi:hypothetical protein